MSETVLFNSRMIGDPVRTIEVRCEYIRYEHAPDIVQRGARGSEQRSVQPYTVTLLKVNMQDVAAMRGIKWTHIGWNDEGRTVEYQVPTIQVFGDDLRCVYRP